MINKYKASNSSYEATKLQTTITKDFGNKLRMVVNKLIGLKHRYLKEETKAKIKSLDSSIKFRGIIMTNGIDISVIKQNFVTSKGGTSNPKASLVEEEFKYIEQIPNEELRSTDGK
ncbi:hypothetical protein BD770DRAFT_398268 [Pilaira anomala]|nr:hypothetical protein BD770DRAFT_398268 [Pilaira anomala]